mgnify:CR=1 FL=1
MSDYQNFKEKKKAYRVLSLPSTFLTSSFLSSVFTVGVAVVDAEVVAGVAAAPGVAFVLVVVVVVAAAVVVDVDAGVLAGVVLTPDFVVPEFADLKNN